MTRCGATAARCPRRRSASTSASPIRADAAMQGERPNIISPPGFAALRAEYDALLGEERPKLVEIISWAAGNGDRSENGDYIYGRKRQIGRAHVCTPVTNAHHVCRLLLEQKKNNIT